MSLEYSYVYMTLNIQTKSEKLKHADVFFQTKYFDVFNSKDRSLCIKLILVGMTLPTLNKDERVEGDARDKVTIKY